MNRIIQILMRRDELTEAEATELYEETKAEIVNAVENEDYELAEDILAGDLGLEPDYFIEMFCTYEESAECAINAIVDSIPNQKTTDAGAYFPYISCCGEVCAFKIRDINDLEAINRWLKINSNINPLLKVDSIGTIQMFDMDCGEVWYIGTPENLKNQFAEAVDRLVDKLVENSEEN